MIKPVSIEQIDPSAGSIDRLGMVVGLILSLNAATSFLALTTAPQLIARLLRPVLSGLVPSACVAAEPIDPDRSDQLVDARSTDWLAKYMWFDPPLLFIYTRVYRNSGKSEF